MTGQPFQTLKDNKTYEWLLNITVIKVKISKNINISPYISLNKN